MGREMLVHVFASIQGLEKCLANSRKMLDEQKHQPLIVHKSLAEQDRILRQMRRVANRLQLEFATENWPEAVRSLKIYYGLWTMVRPEIMSTFTALANGKVCLQIAEPDAQYH